MPQLVRTILAAPLVALTVLLPTAGPSSAPSATPPPVSAPAAPPASDSAPDVAPPARAAYVRPVPGAVVRPFDPPAQDWAAGHRGVDLAAEPGDAVASPGAGVVSFAGKVAGKPLVVVTHPDGLRSTLEPVSAAVPQGSVVAAGDAVGTLSKAPGTEVNPSHCAPDDCLHWGARNGDAYVDPLSLLGSAAPIVLLPLP